MRQFIIAAVAAVSLSAPALATNLVDVQGEVLVDTGKGFVAARDGQALQAGDRVMAKVGGGSARIAHAGGCFVDVAAGRVAVVGTCERRNPPPGMMMNGGGKKSEEEDDNKGGAILGGAGAGALGGGAIGTLAVVGGIAAAVGVGVAVSQNNNANERKKQASP
jgi:hypothetical protein